MARDFVILCTLIFAFRSCGAQYIIPDVKIEVFKVGFRASIPDSPDVQAFAFHGKRNVPLSTIEPGEYTQDVRKSEGNFWVYNEPNAQLEIGDVLYYWVFVQHNRLGYRKDDLKFVVEKIDKESDLKCDNSVTTLNNGQTVCKGTIIFEDFFSTIDDKKWTVENYIPNSGPNFEFNSYENKPEIVSIRDAKLQITPYPKVNNTELRGTLDLRKGCTSPHPEECLHQQQGINLLPAVRSGKLTSKVSFKYGRVEIRAKLPAGDWIFPDISLIQKDKPNDSVKLWVAYARGNENLVGNDGDNIGGKLLFGGPVLGPGEPERSAELKSRINSVPFTQAVHTYSLIWEPSQIRVLVDGVEYGKVRLLNDKIRTKEYIPFSSEVQVVLGVGVGGIHDFPDGYKSGGSVKPWTNADRTQLKDFFEARNQWMNTWNGNDASLQVEYVKVYAI